MENVLSNVTNTVNCGSTYKKRLKSGELKEYTRKNYLRHNITLNFEDEAAKYNFIEYLEKARKILHPATTSCVLLAGLKCIIEDSKEEQDSAMEESFQSVTETSFQSMTDTVVSQGITYDEDEENNSTASVPNSLIFDEAALRTYTREITDHSRMCEDDLSLKKIRHVTGFVKELNYECKKGHKKKIISSSFLGEFYTTNCLLFVAFACSGMLKVQFEKFVRFSNLGNYHIETFKKLIVAFGATVGLLKMESIYGVINNETTVQDDIKKISIETDARHACRKNSVHSDVVALGSKTHKVVSIVHVTKKDEPSSQKHELYGTKKIYEDLKARGLEVNDHAHDRNTSVNKFIREENGPTSTNDRWHAVKAIAKGVRELGRGSAKWSGVKWHPQLCDKECVIKNQVYWAIANCEKNPQKLRENIDKCIPHFQGNHEMCVADSPCKEEDYVMSVDMITDPKAVEMLSDYLHKTTLYRFPADYANSKDTYFVESFNNTCLMYLDKRIHYGDFVYEMRQDLAVLDWNEHCCRGYTSIWDRERVRHSNRIRGKKTYKKKTYSFVSKIWELLSTHEYTRNNLDVSSSQMTEIDTENGDE